VPWLDAYPGAAEEVLALRNAVVHSALGEDYETACAILDRMFLPSFEFATDLRARFDPEYCDGSLDYVTEDTNERIANSLVDDLKAHDCRDGTIREASARAEAVRREQTAFLEHLATTARASILEDPQALRVVKIAFHIDAEGMKEGFVAGDTKTLERAIDRAIAERAAYEKRLVGLRLHHQLTILLLDGYKDLARTLAY
jgi:hypothetical protein